MIKEATPKKVAFVSKPYTQEERIKKEEAELEQLLKEQKGEAEAKAEEQTEESEDTNKEEPTSAEEKTFKKRYGDLRRHTQEKEREFQKQLNELKDQLAKATKKEMKLPKSDEDIEAWATEYPDVAKIVETIAMKKAREQAVELENRIQKIDEMSDFGDIRDSDDFHEWAEEQPKWVQDALYENDNDARSAARAIDLYKSDRNISKNTKTKSDKSAAMDIGTKTTKTKVDTTESSKKIRESDVQKMSATQYEKQADTIMEAIRSGNFVYDISGSAR